jgi:hypothetical protein
LAQGLLKSHATLHFSLRESAPSLKRWRMLQSRLA